MKELSPEEIKKIELDLLLDIAEFCKEHGITYYLAYGTLIGAARHQGFIPWDDDIDLQMPRPDYERFIQIYNEKKRKTHYYAVSPHDSIARHTFVKVIDTDTVKIEPGIDYGNHYLGVDIDIFPLDGQPDRERKYKRLYRRKKIIYLLHYCKLMGKNARRRSVRFIAFFAKAIRMERLLLMADHLSGKYPWKTSKYVGSIASFYNSKKNRFRKEWYEATVPILFEGHYFTAPAGYDHILKTLYGAYMELPPVDQQVTHHVNKAYRK